MSSPDRFSCAALAVGLLLLAPAVAHAHAMLHEIVAGEAVIVRLSFPGHDQPLFEPYEVFAPGSETPFQAGRVNALGELSFRPDRAGTWRLRVFTQDGHGADLELEVDAVGAVTASGGGHGHAHDYWFRVLAALGYLLGAFGLVVLWRQRRAPARPA